VLPPSDPIEVLLGIAETTLIASTAPVGVGPQRGSIVASH
jgi:hypothetical protein